jgi:hypothetical protein
MSRSFRTPPTHSCPGERNASDAARPSARITHAQGRGNRGLRLAYREHPDLRIQLGGREISCQSGRQLGSLNRELTIPWDALITCPASCSRECAIFRTSLGFLSWTNGHATAMDGRQFSFARRQKASAMPQHSLTRAIASMPASGRFLTLPFEVLTRATASTRMSRGGNHLSQHSVGQRRWMLRPFGSALPIFPTNGTRATGSVWKGWWKRFAIDGLRSGN